jgi:cell division transport system permease protein
MPSKKDVAEIESRLRECRRRWRFVPREDALKADAVAAEGMAEIIASLPKNPLPDAFVVEPADTQPEALEALAKAFSGWPKVAHVQLDSAWVKRFDALLRIGKLVVTLLAGLFAGAIGRRHLQHHSPADPGPGSRDRVGRLIGATDAFIRRPGTSSQLLFRRAAGGAAAACLR